MKREQEEEGRQREQEVKKSERSGVKRVKKQISSGSPGRLESFRGQF